MAFVAEGSPRLLPFIANREKSGLNLLSAWFATMEGAQRISLKSIMQTIQSFQ